MFWKEEERFETDGAFALMARFESILLRQRAWHGSAAQLRRNVSSRRPHSLKHLLRIGVLMRQENI